MNNREAFEAWAEKELLPLDKRDSEHYRYNLTNRAWAGWKAALASQAQQPSEFLRCHHFMQEHEYIDSQGDTWTENSLSSAAQDFLSSASKAYDKYLQSQAQQENHDELTLRRLLCMVYSGSNAYMDDGELQDNTALPFIDFKRDSAWELQKKLHARLVNSVVILEPPSPPAPEGESK